MLALIQATPFAQNLNKLTSGDKPLCGLEGMTGSFFASLAYSLLWRQSTPGKNGRFCSNLIKKKKQAPVLEFLKISHSKYIEASHVINAKQECVVLCQPLTCATMYRHNHIEVPNRYPNTTLKREVLAQYKLQGHQYISLIFLLDYQLELKRVFSITISEMLEDIPSY